MSPHPDESGFKATGLWVGQDARPTGVVRFDTHTAPLGLQVATCAGMSRGRVEN